MASPTYDKIASVLLDSSASSLVFDDIPTTDANSNSYKDLILVTSYQTASDSTLQVRFNDDSSSSYTLVRMWGTGSSASTDARTQTYADMETGSTSAQKSQTTLQIMDFADTTRHKSILYRTNQNYVAAGAQRWASTSAITKISITVASSTFNAGTTFDLYAIAG